MSNSRRGFLKMLGLAPAAVAATSVAEAKPAQLTLEDAVKQLEAGREVKQGLLGPHCQTGAPYIAITHGGVKAEGERFLGFNDTREGAIRGWLNAALLYARDRPGVLYWRTRPEIDVREVYDKQPDWMVYSRFVISDAYEVFEEPFNMKVHGWPK